MIKRALLDHAYYLGNPEEKYVPREDESNDSIKYHKLAVYFNDILKGDKRTRV